MLKPTAQQNNGNMSRINGKEVNLKTTKNLELNKAINGIEGDGATFVMGQDINEMAKTEAASKFNNQVDEYVEKLNKHSELLQKYTEEIGKDLDKLEIKPLYEGVLIKPYEENPFQRIEKQGAIITDLGGQKPVYKSHETGEYEEEEQFIHAGLVVDAGPTAKYVQEGDIVFWRRVSETPVPFFKQNLVLVAEHSIMTVVNQGLATRFNKINNYVQ